MGNHVALSGAYILVLHEIVSICVHAQQNASTMTTTCCVGLCTASTTNFQYIQKFHFIIGTNIVIWRKDARTQF